MPGKRDVVSGEREAISGGASNRKVVIKLPHTDLRLVSVPPNRADLRGAHRRAPDGYARVSARGKRCCAIAKKIVVVSVEKFVDLFPSTTIVAPLEGR